MSRWKTRIYPGSAKQVQSAKPNMEYQLNFINRKVSKFEDYQQSVSDAWNAKVRTDGINTPAISPSSLRQNEEESRDEIVMPPVNIPNARNSRGKALQRLAIQREPLPSMPSHNPPAKTQTLPKLPEISGSSGNSQSNHPAGASTDKLRFTRLKELLGNLSSLGNIDLDKLRDDCWMGIPHRLRPIAWRLLSGYLPADADIREIAVEEKRKAYWRFVEQYFTKRFNDDHYQTFRQIHIDIPRMCPLIPLFQQRTVQEIFERILFIWAIHHPDSGYVQGINDLVTPFFVVFLSEFIANDVEVGSFQVGQLSLDQRQLIEADSFWCVRALLTSIQDNYIFEQPGIQRKVLELENLTSRVDKPLHDHLVSNGVEFLQFSFRWMNNILMREIPLRATIRLWDTYLCEPDGFSQFHNYVCSAFLRKWSRPIQLEKDFQGIIILLQNLPTQSWGDREICELTADAYSLMSVFDGARSHFQAASPSSSSSSHS